MLKISMFRTIPVLLAAAIAVQCTSVDDTSIERGEVAVETAVRSTLVFDPVPRRRGEMAGEHHIHRAAVRGGEAARVLQEVSGTNRFSP